MSTQDHKEVCGTMEQSEDDGLAEFYENLSKNFDVLPLFERQYGDFVSIRQYSMTTNEKLRNRWRDRVLHGKTGGTKVAPSANVKFGQKPIPDDMMMKRSSPNHPQSLGANKTKKPAKGGRQINKKTK